MPKISDYNYQGPLAWSDRLIGVFNGATNGVSLEQFRAFFGVGTNFYSLPQYPADPTLPEYGKNGDIMMVTTTGNLYRRANGTYPPANTPFMTMQGTRVNDGVVSVETSWSSDKIARMLASTRNAHLSFTPADPTRILTYKNRVAIEELSINRGINEFSYRLVKSSGTLVGTYPNFGDLNLAVGQLSAADVTAGFDLEITYVGSALLTTAVYRSVVI